MRSLSYISGGVYIYIYLSLSLSLSLSLMVQSPKCKNHNEKPPGNSYKQASSKQSPGEQYRAGKQTSDKDY